MKLYNTYTKKIEKLKPLEGKTVKIYSCGPTVYSFAHIGNLRTYIFVDVLRRALEYSGYRVIQVKNITDVGHLTEDDLERGEDKIIAAARSEGKGPKEIADFYTQKFIEDEKKLNILPPSFLPRATETIDEMIELIKILLAKDYAYEKNGSVFFNVAKFSNYGKLSGNTLENLKTGARLESHPDKIHPADFALWLKAPKNHLMQWDSPWSRGYPGWHIECSAMAKKYLGEQLDIHTGGEDNIFPHHEDEIAQSEAASGKKFARFWFHTRHLLAEGKKMAKSEGNYYTLADLEKLGFSPLAFRLLMLQSHYRSPMNFSVDSLKQAAEALTRIKEFAARIYRFNDFSAVSSGAGKLANDARRELKAALKNDLDTPAAVAALFKMISALNSLFDEKAAAKKEIKTVKKILKEFDEVLAIIPPVSEAPEEIKNLAEKREKYRHEGNWKEADRLRAEIKNLGYEIEDTETGPMILKK